MNMKRYDTYKPSGIDWIGEVPEHWEVNRLKLYFRIISGSGFKLELQGEEDGDYPVCKASDISAADYKIQSAVNYISKQTAKDAGFTIIPQGSVLFAKIGEAMKKNNRAIAAVDCCVDNNCQGMVPKNINPYFGYYLFRCIDMAWYDNGGTIPCINNQKLLSSRIPVPTATEQKVIVEYLDARCADIDKVVATQQKRIALLQELKQSEITQAVTRGLNPDARMKDSGVEWIGMVPEHWEVKKLKFVVSCNDDVLNDRTEDDQIIRYVEISDVNSIEGITNSTEYEFKKAPSRARRITKKDDVIVSTVRTYLKAIAKVKEDDLIVSTGFAVLRAKNINPSFLAYSTLSELFLGTVISESVGVSYPAINSSDIINIKLPVPPSDEQVEIAEYLDRRCGEIDKQIGAVTKQIELLREYKQALITEVVTGKRRV